MKHFYFCSTLMWDASVERMVDMAVRNGFEGIELWAQHVETKGLNLDKLLRLKEETGISLIVHAKSWDLNYAALNRSVREASIKEILSSIDLAAFLGADEVTVHPPRYTLTQSADARDRAYDSISRFAAYGQDRQVAISMELMEHLPKEMATTPAEMRSIVRDLERRLAFTIDLAHCLSEEEFLKNIGGMAHVSKAHISNKLGKRLHVPLPDGDMDFQKIYPKLQDLGIPMVIEGYEAGNRFEALVKNITYINHLKGDFV